MFRDDDLVVSKLHMEDLANSRESLVIALKAVLSEGSLIVEFINFREVGVESKNEVHFTVSPLNQGKGVSSCPLEWDGRFQRRCGRQGQKVIYTSTSCKYQLR